jgi:hypothetical protein
VLSAGNYALNVSVNDTYGNVNSSVILIHVTSLGSLSVVLVSPTGTGNQPQNQTFNLVANVSCLGSSGETCGIVSGYGRYNLSSSNPDTNIQGGNSYSTPFYTIESNPRSCGILKVGDSSCQLTWQVNTTGTIGNLYSLDSLFSSNESIPSANTADFQIKIISPIISLTLSNELLDVSFGGSLLPGTTENPALNNSQDAYYVTCSHPGANCNVSISGSDLSAGINKIGVGNVSWGKVDDNSTGSSLSPTYSVINSSLPDSSSQPIYFWMSVPSGIVAGNYKGNFTIFGSSN